MAAASVGILEDGWTPLQELRAAGAPPAPMADCGRRSHWLLTRACGRPGSPTDVLELIDELRGLVHGAKRVPLRDGVRVDKKKLYDRPDETRWSVSEQVRQARWIVTEREELLAEAKREVERILEEARAPDRARRPA